MPSPGGQPVYIAVVGLTGGAYKLKAGPVEFGLAEITPARANRAGQTTITIAGAGFTDDAKAALGSGDPRRDQGAHVDRPHGAPRDVQPGAARRPASTT